MNRVIINADDFGINKTVAAETIRLLRDGKISSATIMANGTALDEVKVAVADFPNASFGVHLCLTEYQSLTKSEILEKYHITDGNGDFAKRAIFNVSSFPEELCLAIKHELSAQIEKLLDMGIPISHADSHHLVHTNIAALSGCFVEVFDRYGIKRVRIGEEIKVSRVLYNNLIRKAAENHTDSGENTTVGNESGETIGYVARMKRLVASSNERRITNRLYHQNFSTTDVFNSYNGFLATGAQLKNNGCVELMCHPGHTNQEYVSEINKIEQKKLDALLQYTMISYNNL